MKLAALEREYKKAHVIKQLHQRGFFDTDGLDYEELKQKLAIAKALESDEW